MMRAHKNTSKLVDARLRGCNRPWIAWKVARQPLEQTRRTGERLSGRLVVLLGGHLQARRAHLQARRAEEGNLYKNLPRHVAPNPRHVAQVCSSLWRPSRCWNWARDGSLEICGSLVSRTTWILSFGVHLILQKLIFPTLVKTSKSWCRNASSCL